MRVMSAREPEPAAANSGRRRARLWASALVFAACCALVGWRVGAGGLGFGPRTAVLLLATAASFAWLWRTVAVMAGARPTGVHMLADAPAKRIMFATAALMVSLGTVELTVPATAQMMPDAWRRAGFLLPGDGPARLGVDYFKRWVGQGFDAELGWDRPELPDVGPARPAPMNFATTRLSTYGDSFTEGESPENETWQVHLARHLGTNVVNYGVGGYGPDQALLKLKRVYAIHPTPIVLFGYMSENISRIVNVYRLAYQTQRTGTFLNAGQPYFAPTKPRFTLENGQLRLVENPVRSEADLMKLVFESGYATRLAANDYYKEGYDLNRFAVPLSFPYTVSVARGFLQMFTRQPTRVDYASILLGDAETVRLLAAILDEAAAYSRLRGFTLVFVLFGDDVDLQELLEHGRHRRLAPVIKHLTDRRYAFIDTVALLADHVNESRAAEPLSVYYSRTSHHTSYAHRIIARGMADWLWRNGMATATLDDRSSRHADEQ